MNNLFLCGTNEGKGSREVTVGGDTSGEEVSLCPTIARLKPAKDKGSVKETPVGKENEEGE